MTTRGRKRWNETLSLRLTHLETWTKLASHLGVSALQSASVLIMDYWICALRVFRDLVKRSDQKAGEVRARNHH